jgi:hypothetical protein
MLDSLKENGHMVQFGVWTNCCNNCDFCLREERIPYSKEKQLLWLERIKENIGLIDWKNEFSYGISLLGGELYFITDEDLQQSFLELIDIIIEKILKVSENPNCKYSTVTNGLYEPTFLYKVVDKIKDAVGIQKVDINFSYDLKHRFSSEERRLLCLNNINDFHKRYNYDIGVQMIMTQYVIDEWKKGNFDVKTFEEKVIPGNHLTFLYPHPIRTGLKLNDFNFKRSDFLTFIQYLKSECYPTYFSFLQSTKNSCTFKYTGLRDRGRKDSTEMPQLSDGKEIINSKCGHSELYKCYSDCDKCMLCDLINFDNEVYL